MKLSQKIQSRKLWATGAGMGVGVTTGNPVMSIVIGAVYVVVQGIVDAIKARRENERGTE